MSAAGEPQCCQDAGFPAGSADSEQAHPPPAGSLVDAGEDGELCAPSLQGALGAFAVPLFVLFGFFCHELCYFEHEEKTVSLLLF